MVHETPILEARDLRKTYRLGRARVPVLRGADLAVARGEFVAVLGASGSGKSTLLHLLGGLDRPDGADADSGVFFEGQNLARFSESALNAYRRRSVGFVFQFYHLLPELTVLENVMLGAMVGRGRLGYLRERAAVRAGASELLDALGIGRLSHRRPRALSGGERQRAAIARALVNHPPVLLADEPTGNLDRATGAVILDSLAEVRDRLGQTIVMVTHDPAIADRADRAVEIVDGVVRRHAGVI
ncbi:MAG: ABC transporter ATP-binding protein [Planctomycetota bacterium]|nr:MAG: ABC transporter ATP-binding protein [Planctomycetota bacterium]